MATKKDNESGIFAQPTEATTAQSTAIQSAENGTQQPKKSSTPAIPTALQGIAPFLTRPKQAFMAAGGTEQQFAREVNFAMQAMLNNSYLLQCAKSDPEYLVEAVKNVGLTGLSLNPELRLGYLVPFKGKIKFMSSYMGKVDILLRTGVVKSIQAELVYEHDEFKYEKGIKPILKHKPDVFAEDKGKLKGGYYIAILANGEKIFDVMPEKRIQEIKSRSEAVKSGKTSPWDTDFEEMAKKTIINWAFKSLPKTGISDDMLKTIEAEADYEREDFEAWKKHQEQQQADAFTQDGKFTPYEEVTNEDNK